MGGFGVGEALVVGGRDAVALHEGLGEVLRALELRGGLRRPEDRETGFAEAVDDARGERRLGADQREGDVVLAHARDQLADVGERSVFKAGFEGRAGVARGDVDLADAVALKKTPGECVFAAAAANHKKIHGKPLGVIGTGTPAPSTRR